MLKKLKAWIKQLLKQRKKSVPDDWDNWYPDNFI